MFTAWPPNHPGVVVFQDRGNPVFTAWPPNHPGVVVFQDRGNPVFTAWPPNHPGVVVFQDRGNPGFDSMRFSSREPHFLDIMRTGATEPAEAFKGTPRFPHSYALSTAYPRGRLL